MAKNISEKKSGRQLSEDNYDKFVLWVATQSDDSLREMVNFKDGVINRGMIANGCEFGRAVLRQNPKVKKELLEWEDNLRTQGILPNKVFKKKADNNAATVLDQDSRLKSNNVLNCHALEVRIQELEAENDELRSKLSRLDGLNSSLLDIGWAPL